MSARANEDRVEILVAEDSPTQAEHLQYILEQHGYGLTVTRNGLEALAAIAIRRPTLVISDVIMPRMDGYTLCSRIKQNDELRKLPVILLTSLSDPADVVRGLESGADSFIFKPYDEEYLLRRISYTLANRHLRENETSQMGVEVVFAGRKFFITSDRLQILNLLLSTYEAAVHKNQELTAAQDELRHLNEHLETRIKERTVTIEAEVMERKQAQGKLQQAYDDLRQSQQTLMQQERLSALGQMASGVAHDINNAISPIALYTESLLEQETNLSERARKYLTTIQRSIDDVAQTVARMREFYRPNEPQRAMTYVDLNELVQQVLELTRMRWRAEPEKQGIVIDVQTDLAMDLPAVKGAESEIRDALTNLVFNAIDAMPAGGALTLRTGTIHSTGTDLVRLEVCDTGIGMDTETRRRCLEPFFTTKGERGTGLGLAMIYGMVKRHSAAMEIHSEPGRGTTIRLDFAVPAEPKGAPVCLPAPQWPRQPLRLLLVDDDPLMIESLRNTLEVDGHMIATAQGGQAGIDAFTAALAQGESFAAVITDLGMPYVDGRRVAAAIKASSPSTPVILLTGWGQRLIDEKDIPEQVDRVLNKPPKLSDLRSALAALADLPPA